jgi:hypothetical protein
LPGAGPSFFGSADDGFGSTVGIAFFGVVVVVPGTVVVVPGVTIVPGWTTVPGG